MQYIQLQPQLASSIPTPALGSVVFFIDSNDGFLKIKNDSDQDNYGAPYVSGGTYSGGILVFTKTDGSTFSVTGFTDFYITGGTFSAGTITFENNQGQTFDVTGIPNTFLTGGTYVSNTITLTNNDNSFIEITGFTSGGVSFEEKTYGELYSMYTGGELVAGSYYKITDFQTCYDQPDYDQFGNPIYTGNYRTADIDPIIVFATSNSSLAAQAYQPSHPKDKITYDITFTTTERTDNPAKGRITERVDEYNNRTDYDHRAVKFKRYTTYFVTSSMSGRITGFTDLNVYGKDTTFLSDFAVGDVVFIETNTPRHFEITNIISNTEMTVFGYSYDNFTDNFGYEIYKTETRSLGGQLVSLEYKQNNFSADTAYYEQFTFENINYFANNYIGDHANLFSVYDNDFILSNNVFSNSDNHTVDIDSNNFGVLFYNNSFGDDVVDNLFVGGNFNRNTFYDRFRSNIIKANFYNNVWYDNEFNSNNVGDDFRDNWNNGGSFNNNEIGNEFYNNSIRGVMYENKIGPFFNNNRIYDEFYRNDIGVHTSDNNFYGVFYQNKIGGYFQSNNVWSVTYRNEFKDPTTSNSFGAYGLVNSYSIVHNTFGKDFNGNTFSGDTTLNNIQDYFENNLIATNFSYNVIGNYFSSNIIQEGFGFGGAQSQKNIIGDYFQSNNVGEYFYNNRVSNYFSNNTLGDFFQRNNIDTIVNTVDFTVNYGNITAFTYSAIGTTASDNIYNNLDGATNAKGVGATFNVEVSGGVVIGVTGNSQGTLYEINDTITILGTNIGGVHGAINGYSSDGVGKNGSDGTYNGLSATGGTGINATFDVNVTSSLVDSVGINNTGTGYEVGDTLVIIGSLFGGVDGVDDITISVGSVDSDDVIITVTGISEDPSVYQQYNCDIFERRGGDKRLSYYDENDILTITDIDE